VWSHFFPRSMGRHGCKYQQAVLSDQRMPSSCCAGQDMLSRAVQLCPEGDPTAARAARSPSTSIHSRHLFTPQDLTPPTPSLCPSRTPRMVSAHAASGAGVIAAPSGAKPSALRACVAPASAMRPALRVGATRLGALRVAASRRATSLLSGCAGAHLRHRAAALAPSAAALHGSHVESR
jgi:hypothetical protein